MAISGVVPCTYVHVTLASIFGMSIIVFALAATGCFRQQSDTQTVDVLNAKADTTARPIQTDEALNEARLKEFTREFSGKKPNIQLPWKQSTVENIRLSAESGKWMLIDGAGLGIFDAYARVFSYGTSQKVRDLVLAKGIDCYQFDGSESEKARELVVMLWKEIPERQRSGQLNFAFVLNFAQKELFTIQSTPRNRA